MSEENEIIGGIDRAINESLRVLNLSNFSSNFSGCQSSQNNSFEEVIDINGLKAAFAVFYTTKERFKIELEEVIWQFYATEEIVDQKLIEDLILERDDEESSEELIVEPKSDQIYRFRKINGKYLV